MADDERQLESPLKPITSAINTNTGITLGLVITIVGFVWWASQKTNNFERDIEDSRRVEAALVSDMAAINAWRLAHERWSLNEDLNLRIYINQLRAKHGLPELPLPDPPQIGGDR